MHLINNALWAGLITRPVGIFIMLYLATWQRRQMENKTQLQPLKKLLLILLIFNMHLYIASFAVDLIGVKHWFPGSFELIGGFYLYINIIAGLVTSLLLLLIFRFKVNGLGQ